MLVHAASCPSGLLESSPWEGLGAEEAQVVTCLNFLPELLAALVHAEKYLGVRLLSLGTLLFESAPIVDPPEIPLILDVQAVMEELGGPDPLGL